MYADRITDSMQKTIDETNYRREKQLKYNEDNNITPTALKKSFENMLVKSKPEPYTYEVAPDLKAAEEETEYFSKPQLEKRIREKRKAMEAAAKELDFMTAAKLRDEIKMLQEKVKEAS
jgi:excinuclease ABC subunit B